MNLVGGWGAGVESWRGFTAPTWGGALLSQLCVVGKVVGGTGS